MVAIAQQIVLVIRPPVCCVERKTGQVIGNEPARHGGFAGDLAQCCERQRHRCVSIEGGGGQSLETGLDCHGVIRGRSAMAKLLSVGQIIGGPAPGIEQPCPFARRGGKQLARGGKALRALGDGGAGGGNQCEPRGHRRSSALMAAPSGTGGRPERIRAWSAHVNRPA